MQGYFRRVLFAHILLCFNFKNIKIEKFAQIEFEPLTMGRKLNGEEYFPVYRNYLLSSVEFGCTLIIMYSMPYIYRLVAIRVSIGPRS